MELAKAVLTKNCQVTLDKNLLRSEYQKAMHVRCLQWSRRTRRQRKASRETPCFEEERRGVEAALDICIG
jgi:hypothetical protein